MTGRAMTRAEVAGFAEAVAGLLAEPGVELTEAERLRWQGALTALEAVLGRSSGLIDPALAAECRTIL